MSNSKAKNKLFECQHLSIGYTSTLAKNISFEIPNNHLVFIKGRNGSGKSTFINTILGRKSPISGHYKWFIGHDRIAYLPQITNPSSHFSYTIGEILDLYNIAPQYRSMLANGLENKKWIDASGGEKQKVMILSRLSKNTEVLILDEPFNHLDNESINSIVGLLVDLFRHNNISVVLVSHLEVVLPDEIQTIVELNQ